MIYDNDPYSQTNYFEEKMNYTENYAMKSFNGRKLFIKGHL